MSGPLIWIKPDTPLPEAAQALTEPPGLVAAGLDLSVPRLVEAYSKGIFPWFSQGDPVLWWSPDPRMVLKPADLHISKSLGKTLRQIERHQQQGDFNVIVTTDWAFDAVMQACAAPTANREDTWITSVMQQAYQHWHTAGGVHSVETWVDGQLAGGLYGVCLGKMFFGESMFTRVTNASKIALVHLIRYLQQQGVTMIDCQMQTDHLASLGARTIDRAAFIDHVTAAVEQPAIAWGSGWIDTEGAYRPTLPEGTAIPLTPFRYD